MRLIKTNRKIGFGSLSLLLWIMGILFSFSFGSQGAIGDRIVEIIGLRAWSNIDTGTHYTVFYSFIFFIPSLILANQYKEDIGAKLGGRLSLFMVVWMGIMLLSF